MLILAQDRKCSSHSFLPETPGAIERPASSGQTNPLSLDRYHPSISSSVSRKTLPKPGSRGLSLHDLFAAAVGGLLIAPIAWAGADFQTTQSAGPVDSNSSTEAPTQADSRIAVEPGTGSISSEAPSSVVAKSGFVNNDSPQAIVLQWTGPNGGQWAVPLSFEPVPVIKKINTPLAMIGVPHASGEPKPETPSDNSLSMTSASNLTLTSAPRHATRLLDSDDAQKAQPKL